MTFQSTIKRQYTTGFPGEIVRDGPQRSKAARISSATLDGSGNTNRISRAFGWTADLAALGQSGSASNSTLANLETTVGVGAIPFAGVLVNPKHYALQGNAYGTGGTLAPTMDLPQYAEAEFMDMGIIVAELFNEQTVTKSSAYGDSIAYVSTATTGGQNAQGLPLGALVSYPSVALASPVQTAPATATTGGTLAAATYYYKVTALNANGETLASNELSQTTTGTTSTVTVNWGAVAGATGYKIYRGTSAGAESIYYTVGAVTTFTDTGAANTAGTVPTANTTTNPPAGFTAIPNARVINTISLSASASGAVVSGYTVIQLTQ